MLVIWFNKSMIMPSESQTTAAARVKNINTIIDTLIDAQLFFTGDPMKHEYKLDDGQTKISVTYNSLDAVANSIISWERVKQIYLNRYNGRMYRALDSKNFPNWRTGVNII